jgi:glycosyltransferase involved in cell wall biosynthesis
VLSFIVPMYNSSRTIEDCLRSILSQDLNGIESEVIVVDNGSTDSTCDLVGRMPVRLIHEAIPGAAAARNRGISEARGEVIALIDSDCEIPPDWTRRALELLSTNHGVCGVGGPGRMPARGVLARCMNGLHYGITSGAAQRYVRSLATMDAMYLGDVLRKHPFDTDCYWAEDADMNLRLVAAGHKLLFDPRLAVLHHHPMDLRGILRKWYEYGIQYPVPYLKQRRLRLDPGFLSRVLYLPSLLGLILLSAVKVLPWPLPLAALLSLPLVYFVIGLKAVRGFDRLVFPLIHTSKQWAHMIGLLVGLLSPSRRVRRPQERAA